MCRYIVRIGIALLRVIQTDGRSWNPFCRINCVERATVIVTFVYKNVLCAYNFFFPFFIMPVITPFPCAGRCHQTLKYLYKMTTTDEKKKIKKKNPLRAVGKSFA